MDWSDSWRDAFRIELRAEAIGLASRGWPVLPGTYPAGTSWVGRDGAPADGLAPVDDDWAQLGDMTPERAAAWADGRPYSLLAATGTVLNAVEVDEQLGRRTATLLRTCGDGPVPIVATPLRRWLFLTEVGGSRPDLAASEDVTLHGEGSWLPLPPSPYLHGIAHWRVKPAVCGWRLPSAEIVQDAIAAAVAHPTTMILAAQAA